MNAKNAGGQEAFKYARIKTDLSIQILEGQLRPHDRIPSLNEIALKYKVSKITARRVLNDLVTDGLAYTNPGRGAFVSDASARVNARKAQLGGMQLGVVFEHASGSFMSDIIMGIDEEAFSRNTQINLCISNNSYEREAENLQRLAHQGINRILLFMVLKNEERAINPNIPLYLRLQEQGVQLLLIDCCIPGFPIPAITYDDFNAFRALVHHLKGKGRRQLVFILRRDNSSTSIERLQGFKEGLLENALPYDERRIIRVQFDNLDSIVSDTRDHFIEYLMGAELPEAVCCSDELVAAGVFEALDRLNVPPDRRPMVSGMGCAKNLHVLKGNSYLLLEIETYKLGREATRAMLQGELPSREDKNNVPFRRVIPVPLRVPKALRGAASGSETKETT